MAENDSACDNSRQDSSGIDPTGLREVRIRNVVGYLLGRKSDIQLIAQCPKMLYVGGLLVLSAGLAREYDGEDLLHEPWYLLIPHVASLATSLLLYCMVRLPSVRSKAEFSAVIQGYPTFLTLFWMTAPLAWCYAIPIERWMSPADATRTNLMMLGIVSVWRVALITRIICVIYFPEHFRRVLITVLFFGNAVMLTALHFMPAPILQIMGGIRLTEAEGLLLNTKLILQVTGFPILLVLGLFYLGSLALKPMTINTRKTSGKDTVGSSAWAFALASVLCWTPVLMHTQPEQQRRRHVERRFDHGNFEEALRFMSSHLPTDFPPHWSPPPHIAIPNQSVSLPDVMEVVQRTECAPWVYEQYAEKLLRKFPDVVNLRLPPNEETLLRYLHLLERLPEDVRPTADDLQSADWANVRGILIRIAEYEPINDETRHCIERIVGIEIEPVNVENHTGDDSENDIIEIEVKDAEELEIPMEEKNPQAADDDDGV